EVVRRGGGWRCCSAAGEGEPENLLVDRSVLAPELATVVRQSVPLAHRSDLRCDLRVAAARQVGEQVVLDLEGQVACQQVKEPTALQVARAEQLAPVPAAARLATVLLLGEGLGARREGS